MSERQQPRGAHFVRITWCTESAVTCYLADKRCSDEVPSFSYSDWCAILSCPPLAQPTLWTSHSPLGRRDQHLLIYNPIRSKIGHPCCSVWCAPPATDCTDNWWSTFNKPSVWSGCPLVDSFGHSPWAFHFLVLWYILVEGGMSFVLLMCATTAFPPSFYRVLTRPVLFSVVGEHCSTIQSSSCRHKKRKNILYLLELCETCAGAQWRAPVVWLTRGS